MAHTLYWPGSYHFYPIGNTSAVCLTRDIAPRVPASLLLLGCGDPQNVLYTVYSERTEKRVLDFTCVDWDGGILARNVLLFAMIIDKVPHQTMWNIFYNMKLDKESHSFLVQQCRKLASLAKTLPSWQSSEYGKVLKMSTSQTLAELRRHWLLYANMADLPPPRSTEIASSYTELRDSVLQNSTMISARSAGVFFLPAMKFSTSIFRQYWETGVLDASSSSNAPPDLLNPTFVYSRGGEKFCTHYGTSPIVPFHLALIFANGEDDPSIAQVVESVTSQFAAWCDAMLDAIKSGDSCPTVRFFWGDALNASQSLSMFHATGKLSINAFVSQWTTQIIQLNRDEYVSAHAPSAFDVVDTSNLVDHLGLLNVLVASLPLMKSLSSSVLYTESLLYLNSDATKNFNDALHADFAAFSLLTGVCPVDYLSGFTSTSNAHEILSYAALNRRLTTSQFHQVTTWKGASSCDAAASSQDVTTFEPRQLATFLCDMYHSLFENEDVNHYVRPRHIGTSQNTISFVHDHYIRESFVLLLKHIKSHLRFLDNEWAVVMEFFFTIYDADKSMPMDKNNSHDLRAQLYRHGLYTVDYYRRPRPTIGAFASWPTVPVLCRIVLVVPRHKLAVLENARTTPPLVCYVANKTHFAIFSSVHAAFGRVINTGTSANPSVRFEQDEHGLKGTSPMVVSFVVPSTLILASQPQDLTIQLALRTLPSTAALFLAKLGGGLPVYKAPFTDRQQVHTLPEQPLSALPMQQPPSAVSSTLRSDFGSSGSPLTVLDEECEVVSAIVVRVEVQNPQVQQLFQGGASPQVKQISPCVMRLAFGKRKQDTVFPFPVMGSQNKVRLARKSLYIEVVVPLSGGLRADGLRLNRWPVMPARPSSETPLDLRPWNLHRVSLNALPTLNLGTQAIKGWLNTHFGAMLSEGERKLYNYPDKTSTTPIDATYAFFKETLHVLLVCAAGVQKEGRKRVFRLIDRKTKNCGTLLLVDQVRLDIASHTVVCDAFALPLSASLISQNQRGFAQLLQSGAIRNLVAEADVMDTWERLLPALAERCRTWEHGRNCEYISSDGVPSMEAREGARLCSCGAGVDVEAMKENSVWRLFAPYATRVAISPLFAVTYLERVTRDPDAHRCALCRGKGKPKIKACTGCRKIRYCSDTCQKMDWKAHKPKCKA